MAHPKTNEWTARLTTACGCSRSVKLDGFPTNWYVVPIYRPIRWESEYPAGITFKRSFSLEKLDYKNKIAHYREVPE